MNSCVRVCQPCLTSSARIESPSARRAERAGVQLITVHGRTRCQYFKGQADWAAVRPVKDAVSVPVIANGDVDSSRKAREVLDFTRADGAMIGRAAHGAPWIFRDVNALLTEGRSPAPLSRTELRDIVLAHLESIYAFHGEDSGLRIARKHLGWYCELLGQDLRDGATGVAQYARKVLMAADSTSAQFARASEQLQGWVDATA